MFPNRALSKKAKSAAIYTAWNTWKERNRRVFDHKALHEFADLQLIKQDILQPALSNYWLSDVENNSEPIHFHFGARHLNPSIVTLYLFPLNI